MNKKNANSVPVFIASLCAVSLASVIILIIISSFLYYQNVRIKGYNKALEKSIVALDKNLQYCQESAQSRNKMTENALDYLKWRFVLREQVNLAGHRLSEKAGSMRKDRELSSLIYYNLGLAHTLASDFDSAIKDFEEAIKNDSKDAYSYYNLGMLCSAYGNNADKAVKYYSKYLEIVPKGEMSDEVRERIDTLKTKGKK